MKNKLDKKFFDRHKISEPSAAKIFYFSINDTIPDLFQQFDRIAKKYNEIRNPYAKAVSCLVFGAVGMEEEVDFLLDEYTRKSKAYPGECYSDFPLLGLQLLFEKYNKK